MKNRLSSGTLCGLGFSFITSARCSRENAAALHASLGTGRGFLLLCRRCCRPAMAKLLPLAATVLLLLLMLLLLLLQLQLLLLLRRRPLPLIQFAAAAAFTAIGFRGD